MSSASRVGSKPVTIPSGVEIKIVEDELDTKGHTLDIKGPKGQLNVPVHPYLEIVVDDGKILVKPNSEAGYRRSGTGMKLPNAISGTMRSDINNAVIGVTQGFERKLILYGVGYRAQVKGEVLVVTIGFSHLVEFPIPKGITIETPTLTEILIKGTSKHLVGHTAAKIKAIRPPEPYKGKGIIDPRRPVVRKETKKK